MSSSGAAADGLQFCKPQDVLGIHLTAVPLELAGATYGTLFASFIRDRLWLPLGLYRASGTLGSPNAYVYTNPSPDTVLHQTDAVYIIRQSSSSA